MNDEPEPYNDQEEPDYATDDDDEFEEWLTVLMYIIPFAAGALFIALLVKFIIILWAWLFS